MESPFVEIIKSDFDKIALFPTEKWNANNHYYSFLLKNIPYNCNRILDVGCGKGDLCRLLTDRASEILGIDVSKNMLDAAQKLTRNKKIKFEIGNYLSVNFPEKYFDCIISVAAVHHLPFLGFIEKVKKELKTNGILIILDLYKSKTFYENVISASALPLFKFYYLLRNAKFDLSKSEKNAWNEHGENDQYMSLHDVRMLAEINLPDSVIKRHLYWRYSLVWKNSQM